MSFKKDIYRGFCFEYHKHFINIHKRNTMEVIKYRVWDKTDKKWFKPIYKRATAGKAEEEIKDIFITQNGEFVMRHIKEGKEVITHELNMEFEKRYEANLRVGLSDVNQKKYHFNDIVCFTDKQQRKSYGVLVWMGDQLGIGSGPINNYTAIDGIRIYELKNAEIVGNIYEDRSIIMGIEPPEESNDDKLKNQLKSKGLTD